MSSDSLLSSARPQTDLTLNHLNLLYEYDRVTSSREQNLHHQAQQRETTPATIATILWVAKDLAAVANVATATLSTE